MVCSVDYKSLKGLTDHVAEEHNYVCEVCHREYKLSDSIRKHCRKEHSDYFKEPIVCCRFCPTMFHNIPAKRAHVSKVHGIKISGHKYMVEKQTAAAAAAENPFPVPAVDPASGADSSLLESSGYACPNPDCMKMYTNPDSLRKHAKTTHEMAVGFCRDCELVFPSQQAKGAHMESLHHATGSAISC